MSRVALLLLSAACLIMLGSQPVHSRAVQADAEPEDNLMPDDDTTLLETNFGDKISPGGDENLPNKSSMPLRRNKRDGHRTSYRYSSKCSYQCAYQTVCLPEGCVADWAHEQWYEGSEYNPTRKLCHISATNERC